MVPSLFILRNTSICLHIVSRQRFLHGLSVISFLALLLIGASSAKAEFTLPFVEDWESGSVDLDRWNRWGYPLSLLDAGANVAGNYSLDPNGDGSYLSGLVSSDTFSLSGGVRVSIDAYIESASQWSELSFGLVNTTAITQNNVHLKHLAAIVIDADTQGSYKFYTKFGGDGGVEVDYPSVASGLMPASVFDAWHTYVFDFSSNGAARVSVDGVITFETDPGFYTYSIDTEFALLLGGRSYSSTVNLYDSVKVNQIPEPSTALSLLAIGTLAVCRRRRR